MAGSAGGVSLRPRRAAVIRSPTSWRWRGYVYNDNPIREVGTLFNIQAPVITQHTVTAGTTIDVSEAISASLGYAYGFPNSLTGPVREAAGVGVNFDSEVHILTFTLQFKFGITPCCKPAPADCCCPTPASSPKHPDNLVKRKPDASNPVVFTTDGTDDTDEDYPCYPCHPWLSCSAMIVCPAVTKKSIQHHYDLATPFYRLLWGPRLHHGLWEGNDAPLWRSGDCSTSLPRPPNYGRGTGCSTSAAAWLAVPLIWPPGTGRPSPA